MGIGYSLLGIITLIIKKDAHKQAVTTISSNSFKDSPNNYALIITNSDTSFIPAFVNFNRQLQEIG